ncbi:MAG: hypothetical protein JSU72_03685 [Deltaproteobacteria bacterium]|nr:MAG: hypothetical protein JSU72_03685 [Deltaproteobacteria bacterium]
MKKNPQHKSSIQLLLDRYRAAFRIPENLDYYSEMDYRSAERKFLKYALEQDTIETEELLYRD